MSKESSQIPTSSSLVLVRGDDEVAVAELMDSAVAQFTERFEGDIELFTGVGAEANIEEVLGLVAQIPMFCRASVVVVRNLEQIPKDTHEMVLSHLESRAEENCVVLGTAAPDSAFAKALLDYLKANATLLNGHLGNDGQRRDYLREMTATSALRFTSDALDLLASTLGQDTSMAKSLIRVIESAFGEGSVVDAQDIEPYLSFDGDVAPWTLTDRIAEGNAKAALELTRRMMVDLQRPPQVLTSVISRYFMELSAISSPSLRTPESKNAALQACGFRPKPPYPLQKLTPLATGFGVKEYRTIFSLIASTERGLRGESGLESLDQMELLVARLSAMCHRASKSRSTTKS